ncbi:MAG: DNA-3-methyladenine glycosylase 2 family protein [Nocardioides sp.]|nr:DNA-3-methyladenine glycosylase 2 family protein [Nocardioides sp.]
MSGEVTRQWQPGWPCRVAQVLGPQRRGSGDPTHRVDAVGRHWRAMRTPEGPATLAVLERPRDAVVEAGAWGAGATWALEALPALLGSEDDPTGFVAHHDAIAEGWRRAPHWRLGRTGLVMESLVPSILEQKVTGKQAFGSFRELVRRHGEPAPGPGREVGLWLQPEPGVIAAIPSWEWLRLGVEPARSRAVVTVCRVAASLERVAGLTPSEADARLRSLPGVGEWTSAEVRQRALGDIDAVSFGDYHVAKEVGWALAGRDFDDAELASELAVYRPQRGRAVAMAGASGIRRPRRGPRMSVPTHLPVR